MPWRHGVISKMQKKKTFYQKKKNLSKKKMQKEKVEKVKRLERILN